MKKNIFLVIMLAIFASTGLVAKQPVMEDQEFEHVSSKLCDAAVLKDIHSGLEGVANSIVKFKAQYSIIEAGFKFASVPFDLITYLAKPIGEFGQAFDRLKQRIKGCASTMSTINHQLEAIEKMLADHLKEFDELCGVNAEIQVTDLVKYCLKFWLANALMIEQLANIDLKYSEIKKEANALARDCEETVKYFRQSDI